MPVKICGALTLCPSDVMPIGAPVSRSEGATRGIGVVVAVLIPTGDVPTALVATTENL